MVRCSRTLPVVAAMVVAALSCAGCGGNEAYLTEDRLQNGMVIILPGIEGHSRINENIRRGLVAGGVFRGLAIRTWGRPVPLLGVLINQVDFVGNRLAGQRIAEVITDYQDKYPGRPVYIVGHSGGGGIAVFTAEALPEDRQIDGLVLLSASISSGYDLKKALSRCRHGIVNFYNKGDTGVLGVGTVVLGTVDGKHGLSAGLVGFEVFDKPGYEGLYQVKMINVEDSSHTTSTQVGFVSAYVAPWVLARSWPAMSGDACASDIPSPVNEEDELARGGSASGGLYGSSTSRAVGRKRAEPVAVTPSAPASPAKAATGKAEAVAAARPRPAKPAAAPKPPLPRNIDDILLAQSRMKNPVRKPVPAKVADTTAAPRLPSDETVDSAGSGRSSRPAVLADAFAPPSDPEDQADPASIGG